MPRLIDAEALAKKVYRAWDLWEKKGNDCFVFSDIITPMLISMPTVDAEPARHGHWVENNGRYGWYCSQCKKENNYAYDYNENNVIELQDHYCPNCGAKMDEVEDAKEE